MATEVETLPPNNPLLQPEEQQHKDGEYPLQEHHTADSGSPGDGQEEQAAGREISEAPLPKVNPWTKKMSSVNGQPAAEHSGPTKVVKAGNSRHEAFLWL